MRRTNVSPTVIANEIDKKKHICIAHKTEHCLYTPFSKDPWHRLMYFHTDTSLSFMESPTTGVFGQL
jgi:hypothetical protein